MTREELLLEGEGALLHAALAFDAGKGARLTTYAWFHIMRALTELVQRVRSGGPPVCWLCLHPACVSNDRTTFPHHHLQARSIC